MKKTFCLTLALATLSICISSFTPNKTNVLLPTSLRVTVLDSNGNIVERATVTLYKSEADYYDEKEPVREPQRTDSKGRVTFKKIAPAKYYVYAKKGDKDNVGEVVSTNKLKEGKMNLVNTIIR